MLDKTEVKNAEAVEEQETVETVKEAEAVETAGAPEAAMTAETIKEAEQVETVETAGAPEAAEAEPVREEPKKKGYTSELDGIEVDFELQYRDRETDMRDIAKRVEEDYAKRGNDASGIKLIQVYLKPTDFTAYYVINNSYEGKIPLF